MTDTGALIGRLIAGRFRITGFIGEGAMATVYRGVQDGEPRDVAIKVMRPHLFADRSFAARFRREAKAASRLNHPNSVRILHYGLDAELLFIVMELLAGRDLFELLTMERRISEARAARIVAEVCDALAAAHEAGVVHRDLKPENVMVLDDGGTERVKVLDFGIAKILSSPETDGPPSSLASSVVTRVGMVVGTPAYMSPEQCRGEAIDGRSDLYGCAVLLFQLITGQLPFPGDRPVDFAIKHLGEAPPAPSALLPSIHRELEALILKALAKQPADRPGSARELADALRQLLPSLRGDLGPLRSPARPRPRSSSSGASDSVPTLEIAKVARAAAPTTDPKRLATLDPEELDQAITLASRGAKPLLREGTAPEPAGAAAEGRQSVEPRPPRRVDQPPAPAPRSSLWMTIPILVAFALSIGAVIAALVR